MSIPTRYDEYGTTNCVKLLPKIDSYNNYIQLYSELDSHIEVGDIVYITYSGNTNDIDLESDIILDNSLIMQSDTNFIYNEFTKGYYVIYVNQNLNSFVINRTINTIARNKLLNGHYVSKISSHNMDFYKGSIDGVLFKNANINVNEITNNVNWIQGVILGGNIYNTDILGKYNNNIYVSLNAEYDASNNNITYFNTINNNHFGYSYFFNLDSSIYSITVKCGNFYNCSLTNSLEKNINGGCFRNCNIDNYVIYNGNFNNTKLINNCSWMNGTWVDGTFELENWFDGNFNNGIFGENSNWYNGNFNGGEWYGINWYNGTFNDGKLYGNPENGLTTHWYNGTFNGGLLYNIIWENGTFNNGSSFNSIFNNIDIYGGKFENIIINKSTIYDGVFTFNKKSYYDFYNIPLSTNFDIKINPYISDSIINGGIFNEIKFHNNTIKNSTFDNCHFYKNENISSSKILNSTFNDNTILANKIDVKKTRISVENKNVSKAVIKYIDVVDSNLNEKRLFMLEFPNGHNFKNSDTDKTLVFNGFKTKSLIKLTGNISSNVYYDLSYKYGNVITEESESEESEFTANANLETKVKPIDNITSKNIILESPTYFEEALYDVGEILSNVDENNNDITINGGSYSFCDISGNITINDGNYKSTNILNGVTFNKGIIESGNFYSTTGYSQNIWNDGIFRNGIFGYNGSGENELKITKDKTWIKSGETFEALTFNSINLVNIYPLVIRKSNTISKLNNNTNTSTNKNNNIYNPTEWSKDWSNESGLLGLNKFEILENNKFENGILPWTVPNVTSQTTSEYDYLTIPYSFVFKINCYNEYYFNQMILYLNNNIKIDIIDVNFDDIFSNLYGNNYNLVEWHYDTSDGYIIYLLIDFKSAKDIYSKASQTQKDAYDIHYKNLWSDINASYLINPMPTLNTNNTNNTVKYDINTDWIIGSPLPSWDYNLSGNIKNTSGLYNEIYNDIYNSYLLLLSSYNTYFSPTSRCATNKSYFNWRKEYINELTGLSYLCLNDTFTSNYLMKPIETFLYESYLKMTNNLLITQMNTISSNLISSFSNINSVKIQPYNSDIEVINSEKNKTYLYNNNIKTNTTYFERKCGIKIKFKDVKLNIENFRDTWNNGQFINGVFNGKWYDGKWLGGSWYGFNLVNQTTGTTTLFKPELKKIKTNTKTNNKFLLDTPPWDLKNNKKL